jgi:hypothetical protein
MDKGRRVHDACQADDQRIVPHWLGQLSHNSVEQTVAANRSQFWQRNGQNDDAVIAGG